jgi:hypothetical protein
VRGDVYRPKKPRSGQGHEFYLNARRQEMQAGMRDLLSQLDGSRAARVAMLAGMTREELEAVGGVQEDPDRRGTPKGKVR